MTGPPVYACINLNRLVSPLFMIYIIHIIVVHNYNPSSSYNLWSLGKTGREVGAEDLWVKPGDGLGDHVMITCQHTMPEPHTTTRWSCICRYVSRARLFAQRYRLEIIGGRSLVCHTLFRSGLSIRD